MSIRSGDSCRSWLAVGRAVSILCILVLAWALRPYASDTQPVVKWEFSAGSRIYTSPVVGDLASDGGLEILTTSSEERKLICLSAAQKTLWTYDDFILRITSTPTLADLDRDGALEILVPTRESGVVCLDSGGRLQWKVPVDGGIPWGGVTAIDADRDGTLELFWVSREGLLECRDPQGAQIWSFQGPKPELPAGPPAAGDLDGDGQAEVVICSGGRTVYVCDNAGEERWRLNGDAPFSGGAVIADVRGSSSPEVLAVSTDGVFWCLAGLDGEIVWTHRTLRTRIDTTIAAGDIDADGLREIFYGDGFGNLYCLDGNGHERWSFQARDWIESAPALGDVDGDGAVEILFGSADGDLYCLSSDGEQEWLFSTGKRIAASPTLCDYDLDGNVDILIPSHSGILYCLTAGGAWEGANMLWPFRRYDSGQTGCLPPLYGVDR